MWNHYIGRQVRRSNRNLLWVNGLLVLVVLAVAVLFQRYLYNFFFGPFPISHKTLMEINHPDELQGYFVTLEGDRVIPKIGEDVQRKVNKTTRAVISETVTAEYMGVPIHDVEKQKIQLLLVRVSKGTQEKQFNGPLVSLPPGVINQIILPMETKNPQLKGFINRKILLDSTGFRLPGYIGLAIGLPILGFGLWNVLRGLRRATNPERHPIIASLARYGHPDEVAAAIDSEIEQEVPHATPGPTVTTSSWLLRPSFFGLQVIHLDDVIWVYKKVTQHSTNGVHTGTTYAAIINQRDGAALEIGGSEQSSEQFLQKIYGNVPWILVGFDAELAGLWKDRRDVVLDIVEQRRKQFLEQVQQPNEQAPES